MLDNLELVLLTIDEVVRLLIKVPSSSSLDLNTILFILKVDNGHIMELDPNAIASRVLMKTPESLPTSGSVGDLSISQALGLARDQIFASLVRQGRGDM